MEDELYWFWINNINGIGRGTIAKMLDYFSTPRDLYHADMKYVEPYLKRESQCSAFVNSKDERIIINNYQKIKGKGIHFLYPGMEEYPEKLLQLCDYPLGLYLKGKLPKTGKTVAIIGARECSNYGKEMARFFGKELARCGVSVISGLARGIDGMAHRGALEAGGYTLGILGCGIDKVYPEENYELFMAMERNGGILSESGLGVKPAPGLFPIRNRLIAALADGILVIEAMEKSGTFITVDQGLELGREIFALPGRVIDVKSRGCNNLLKLGAHPVTEIEDILDILKIDDDSSVKLADLTKLETRISQMSLAPNEKMVYSCLDVEPKYMDDVIKEARIAPQEVCIVLNRLILEGVIVESNRNYYAIRL